MKAAVGILCFLGLTACGATKAIDATKQMPAKMDEMHDQMEGMKRKLTEALTFEAMLKPEYGHDLLPVPFDLMPFAKQFAENADAANIPELFYIWIKKINEVTIDANGTPEPVEAFNHRKMHTLSALQAVAGFLPRAKVVQLIQDQIAQDGRYAESVRQLLMLRVLFLNNVLLDADLLSENMDSVGKVEKAVEYAEEIEFIARLPFAADVQIVLTGFVDPMPTNITEKMSDDVAREVWTKIKAKAVRGMSAKPVSFPVRYKRAMDTVESRLKGWGA